MMINLRQLFNRLTFQSKKYRMTSWENYWKTFDRLIELLKADNQDQIIYELKDAQKYVNGLTDGWYDFKTAFEKTLELNKSKMTPDQVEIANNLIETLNYSLTHRG